jgi:thiamine-monophosphate kinase
MERDLILELGEILGDAGSLYVLCGIGDDAALLRNPGQGNNLLVTTDSQRENVHFKWDWIDPVSLGYRLVVVNVSDIAAKGGIPYAGVVAVGLPENYNTGILKDVYRGIAEACREYGLSMVGGDLSRDRGGWNFVMTLVGMAQEPFFPLRSGLSEGDSIYLLGRPGRARSGFLSLSKNIVDPVLEEARTVFRRPRALLSIGQRLARRPEVRATIDSSDGLERSLLELALASNLSIHVTDIPVNDEIRAWSLLLEERPVNLVWTGGEDYDIVLGVRQGEEKSFEQWAREDLLDRSPERLYYIGKAMSHGRQDLVFSKGLGEGLSLGRGFDHTAP